MSIAVLSCCLLAAGGVGDAEGSSWIAELSDVKAHEAKSRQIEIHTPAETFTTVGVYETKSLSAQAPSAVGMDVYRIRHVPGEGSAGPMPKFLTPAELYDRPDFDPQTSWAVRLYCRQRGTYRVYIEADGSTLTVKLIVSEAVAKSDCGFGFYVDQNRHMYPENLPLQLEHMRQYGCNTLAVRLDGGTEEESLRATAKMLDHGIEIGLIEENIPVILMGGMKGIRQFGERPDKWPELIMYGHDQPFDDDMARVRETRELADALGVRLGTAISPANAFRYGGLLNVWIVPAEHQSRLLRAKARRDKADWWVYTQVLRGSNAALSRYYSGLWTWKTRPRGNLAGTYMDSKSVGVQADGSWQLGQVDGKITAASRALASGQGPIATVGLTGFRDGTVDYRTLCELERLVDQLTLGDNESRLPKKIFNETVSFSRNFLGRLRDDTPSRFETPTLDASDTMYPPLDCVEVRRRSLSLIEELKPWERH